MAVDINWGLATRSPNMLALAQEGFQAGRAQKMQGIQDQALAKISANPDDSEAINALLPVNPGLYGQLAGAQQQRRTMQREQAQSAALGTAVSQLEGLPPGVREYAKIDGKGAIELMDSIGKLDKVKLEATQRSAEQLYSVVDGIAGLPPEQRLIEAQRLAPQFGVDPAKITQDTVSDGGLQMLRTQALGVKGAVDYRMNVEKQQFERQKFGADQQYRQDSLGAQIRGQDMSRGNAMLAASSSGSGGGQGKAPSGYRWKQDGTLEAIPGGPGEGGKLTEGEAKATGLYRSAAASAKALNDLSGKAWKPSVVARALSEGGATVQTSLSPIDRRAYNAFRNLAMASLRLESGAALTPQEISLKAMQFIPLPGDDEATLADKADQRGAALSALRDAGGRGTKNLPRVTAGAAKPQAATRVAGGTLTTGANGEREYKPNGN